MDYRQQTSAWSSSNFLLPPSPQASDVFQLASDTTRHFTESADKDPTPASTSKNVNSKFGKESNLTLNLQTKKPYSMTNKPFDFRIITGGGRGGGQEFSFEHRQTKQQVMTKTKRVGMYNLSLQTNQITVQYTPTKNSLQKPFPPCPLYIHPTVFETYHTDSSSLTEILFNSTSTSRIKTGTYPSFSAGIALSLVQRACKRIINETPPSRRRPAHILRQISFEATALR